MYNYEHCKTALDSLIQYQSNVRQMMISETSGINLRKKLFDNDQEFFDYLTGRIKNADSTANQEI